MELKEEFYLISHYELMSLFLEYKEKDVEAFRGAVRNEVNNGRVGKITVSLSLRAS